MNKAKSKNWLIIVFLFSCWCTFSQEEKVNVKKDTRTIKIKTDQPDKVREDTKNNKEFFRKSEFNTTAERYSKEGLTPYIGKDGQAVFPLGEAEDNTTKKERKKKTSTKNSKKQLSKN